jgi:cytochrome c biogenesis protein CcdA
VDGQRLATLFAAGMAATVNPCGFALLPAYLAFYLGMTPDGSAGDRLPAPIRAVKVGAAMTGGFLVVFGAIGVVWSSISSTVAEHLPWVSVGMGVLLLVLGAAMIAGFEPTVALPKMAVGKGDAQARSMFLFGMSYAVASLSCTIPLFVGVLGISFDDSFASGLAGFAAYGLGMGALVTVLTLAVALARTGLVAALRRALPWITRISGVLVMAGGALVAYYGWASTRDRPSSVQQWLYDVQGNVTTWIGQVGALRVGLMCAVIVAGAVAAGVAIRRRPGRPTTPDRPATP